MSEPKPDTDPTDSNDELRANIRHVLAEADLLEHDPRHAANISDRRLRLIATQLDELHQRRTGRTSGCLR